MFPFFFDPTTIIVFPALVLAIYAQGKVSATFARYSREPASSYKTGAQVARELLYSQGIYDVLVEETHGGRLGDHYDPKAKVVRLSPEVYHGNSLASLGVAAHEVGHAVQHEQQYFPLHFRNGLFPLANLGSTLAFPLFLLGFFLQSFSFVQLGIILFSLAVLFQVITLPVEYNASSRAIEMLESGGYVQGMESNGVRKVLSAAALTYVAATLMALLELVRFLVIAGGFLRNDNE